MAIEKKTETSLRIQDFKMLESYARELFSFSPVPICFITPIGVILEANPAFEKLFGIEVYEAIGAPIENIFDKEKIQKIIKDTLKSDSVEGVEIAFLTKEKKQLLLNVFTKVRRDEEGEATGCFIGFFDVTPAKKTEKELRRIQAALLNILEDTEESRKTAEEEKNKTLSIVTNLTDGLLVFGKDGVLSLVNPEVEKIFKTKNKDLVGQSLEELAKIPELEPLTSLLFKEKEKISREEINIREKIVLEVNTAPLSGKEGILGNVVILHDITREKIVEKMKSEFVSLAAHQLRTPLSAIKWTLKMILEGDLGKITEDQRNLLEKTYKSNERMISLINDLLDVTRIEEGRYVFGATLTNLGSVIQFVVNSFKEIYKKRNLILDFKEPKIKPPLIKVDVEKIRLVLQNLLDNAASYTPEGGKVTIVLKYGKKEAEVSVKDSGIGIPQDQQNKVFEKFFRGSNAVRLDTEGSGLGLYIAKNIVESHEGKVWFESAEGKGTTFYFTLPIKKEVEEFLKEF